MALTEVVLRFFPFPRRVLSFFTSALSSPFFFLPAPPSFYFHPLPPPPFLHPSSPLHPSSSFHPLFYFHPLPPPLFFLPSFPLHPSSSFHPLFYFHLLSLHPFFTLRLPSTLLYLSTLFSTFTFFPSTLSSPFVPPSTLLHLSTLFSTFTFFPSTLSSPLLKNTYNYRDNAHGKISHVICRIHRYIGGYSWPYYCSLTCVDSQALQTIPASNLSRNIFA